MHNCSTAERFLQYLYLPSMLSTTYQNALNRLKGVDSSSEDGQQHSWLEPFTQSVRVAEFARIRFEEHGGCK